MRANSSPHFFWESPGDENRQEFDAKWQQTLQAVNHNPQPPEHVHRDNPKPLNNELSKKLEGIRL